MFSSLKTEVMEKMTQWAPPKSNKPPPSPPKICRVRILNSNSKNLASERGVTNSWSPRKGQISSLRILLLLSPSRAAQWRKLRYHFPRTRLLRKVIGTRKWVASLSKCSTPQLVSTVISYTRLYKCPERAGKLLSIPHKAVTNICLQCRVKKNSEARITRRR